MAADDLATQGARASVSPGIDMVLLEYSGSVPEG